MPSWPPAGAAQTQAFPGAPAAGSEPDFQVHGQRCFLPATQESLIKLRVHYLFIHYEKLAFVNAPLFKF